MEPIMTFQGHCIAVVDANELKSRRDKFIRDHPRLKKTIMEYFSLKIGDRVV